jgi:peptidoglycan/LPS O-acetylase OafA/YrhL
MVVSSFVYQNISSFEHTNLIARLWQFFRGFLAHKWHQSKVDSIIIGDSVFKIKRTFKLIVFILFVFIGKRRRLLETAQFIVFILTLIVDMGRQLNRLLVVLVTSIIIARQTSNFVLNNRLMAKFGNWSYSIYLFHWPLLTLHRFIYMDMYQNEVEASLIG